MTLSSKFWILSLSPIILIFFPLFFVSDSFQPKEASAISLKSLADFGLVTDISDVRSPAPQSTSYQIEFSANNDGEWLISINRRPVFVVKSLAEAAIATAKLSLIVNAPDFDPQQFIGREAADEYVGKYNDIALFNISRLDTLNPSLQLTQWVNNLRVATGAEPLTLVEAQTQIHQLVETGQQIEAIASWYGPYFQGRQTASGEYFEQKDFTAAHPSLPFDTYLRVTNQRNGKSVIVRINDRGPYFGNRSLDLSHAAAIALNSDEVGVVPVTAEILAPS
jgi:rare lipoprotein A